MAIEKAAFITAVELGCGFKSKKIVVKELNLYLNEGILYEFKKDKIAYIEFTKLGENLRKSGFFQKTRLTR